MKRIYLAPRNVSFEEHIRDFAKNAERKFEAKMLAGQAKMEAGGADLELSIMDVIGIPWLEGSITAEQVDRALKRYPSVAKIRVLINSPGGYCSEGTAIYNLLDRHPAEIDVEVVGEAASAASVICMAGKTIKMRRGTWMMVHPALTGAYGYAEDLRNAADYADVCTEGAIEIYVHRTGLGEAEVRELVKNPGTWMTAKKARELGFADEEVEGDVQPAPVEDLTEDDSQQQVDINVSVTTNQSRAFPFPAKQEAPRLLQELASLRTFERAPSALR